MEEMLSTYLLDAEDLLAVRRAIYAGEEGLQAADERLLMEADQALYLGPFSVVDKEVIPPSGDKRDYMSQAPYWWPDSEMEDGLPYLQRDGEVNPESDSSDMNRLAALCSALSTLASAYFFSDHEEFAERAGLLLRTWFLDETTAMNPHLEYGQAIPGRCEGRGSGIIDTSGLGWLVEMVGLLGASPAWNLDDQKGLQRWCATYLDWLLESSHGRAEAMRENHHGTWYDVQLVSLALFIGRDELARKIAEESVPRRIEVQLAPDGAQPQEISRTRSLSYCAMNISAFFDLADLGRRVGVDLWSYEGGEGRSIRRAFNWLVEHAIDAEEWAFTQVSEFDWAQMMALLRRGSRRFGDLSYEERITSLDKVDIASERTNLIYPVIGPVAGS